MTVEAKAHSASDYDRIKTIVAPYWHIFNMCLQQFEVSTIGQINFTYPPKVKPDKPTMISIDFMRDKERKLLFATGADAFPPLLSRSLQAGISRFNMCDASNHLFFGQIQHALQDIGATVEWLTLTPKPRIAFYYSSIQPYPRVRHSLFAITTRHGNKFAADFTIEQFGFEPEMWFQTQKECLDKCTCDNRHRKADIDGVTKRGERRGVGMDRVVQSVCDDLDMAKWKGLDPELRVEWLERIVKEACRKEFEGDKREKRAISWSENWLAKP